MAATDEEQEKETTKPTKKEGSKLLGAPTFENIQNGRLRCVETGHELLEKDKERYSQSKRCRLGLVTHALLHKKPPLNMFYQSPTSRSKLICKLTGDTVNKKEEHIWKHINGRRFLNKLEAKELEKKANGLVVEEDKDEPSENQGLKEGKNKKRKGKKEEKEEVEKKRDDIADEVKDDDDDDDLQEPDFWMPPVGERWDFDDEGDRWGSGADSEEEVNEDENPTGEVDDEDGMKGSDEISTRRKRKPKEMGANSSLKKKNKKNKK